MLAARGWVEAGLWVLVTRRPGRAGLGCLSGSVLGYRRLPGWLTADGGQAGGVVILIWLQLSRLARKA